MNGIKNFIYDKSDIFIALVIVLIAAVIILWRADVILDYPQDLVAATFTEDTNEPITTPIDNTVVPDTDGDGSEGTDTQPIGEPEIFAVYINEGEGMREIGQVLTDLGIFETPDEFVACITSMGMDINVQIGNHFIPAGCTKEECIQYLCEPGLM